MLNVVTWIVPQTLKRQLGDYSKHPEHTLNYEWLQHTEGSHNPTSPNLVGWPWLGTMYVILHMWLLLTLDGWCDGGNNALQPISEVPDLLCPRSLANLDVASQLCMGETNTNRSLDAVRQCKYHELRSVNNEWLTCCSVSISKPLCWADVLPSAWNYSMCARGVHQSTFTSQEWIMKHKSIKNHEVAVAWSYQIPSMISPNHRPILTTPEELWTMISRKT